MRSIPSRPAALFPFLFLLFLSCRGDRVERVPLRINQTVFQVEIADTPESRKKGLMFREEMAPDQGMLFVFEEEKQVSFWMKNTEIPLSVAYISKSGYIREIHDLQPHSLNPVRSSHSVLYALELNQGVFRDKGIRPGDQVILP